MKEDKYKTTVEIRSVEITVTGIPYVRTYVEGSGANCYRHTLCKNVCGGFWCKLLQAYLM